MGLTEVKASVANPARAEKKIVLKFLVDSGAAYSVVPRTTLKKLGIKPHSKKTFILADGETIEREQGDAIFEFEGHRAASPIIFGEGNDSILLGIVTLESLGFVLDPMSRVLRPLPMFLM